MTLLFRQLVRPLMVALLTSLAVSAGPAAASPSTRPRLQTPAGVADQPADGKRKCCTDFVSIPSWYAYDPDRRTEKTLHDYCTKSPDEVTIWPGPDVSLRGPCARHDLCYDYHQHSKTRCDLNLWGNILKQCTHYYTPPDPRWDYCSAHAQGYFAGIELYTIWPFRKG